MAEDGKTLKYFNFSGNTVAVAGILCQPNQILPSCSRPLKWHPICHLTICERSVTPLPNYTRYKQLLADGAWYMSRLTMSRVQWKERLSWLLTVGGGRNRMTSASTLTNQTGPEVDKVHKTRYVEPRQASFPTSETLLRLFADAPWCLGHLHWQN